MIRGGRGGRREDCVGIVRVAAAGTVAKAGVRGTGRRRVSLGDSGSVNFLVILRDRV